MCFVTKICRFKNDNEFVILIWPFTDDKVDDFKVKMTIQKSTPEIVYSVYWRLCFCRLLFYGDRKVDDFRENLIRDSTWVRDISSLKRRKELWIY